MYMYLFIRPLPSELTEQNPITTEQIFGSEYDLKMLFQNLDIPSS